ncbi:MAG: glycosyltransferase [Christensenella sp.]|uniref:glycosyltransferase n=1 Tax=Christensenella sp. TaxID=1935934 RepID=UPI002B1F915F|nr:glycosyltransferase [Christensenella sp.]MEA5003661.1 glycosyltransferase [Christensenella sp.]
MTVALCLIVWNEIDGLKHDLPLLDKNQFDQVYCIDGGSVDGSRELLAEYGIPIYDQTKRGINQACIDGAACCECEAFVFFHPKGTIPVQDTYKFRALFEQGYEFIVGSRMVKGAHNEEDNKLFRPRKWFVLFLARIAAMLFKREGNYISDVLHGFRGMTTESFKRIGISDFDRSIDIEMVCRSYKAHTKRIEFPTTESARLGGETHFKALSTGWQTLKYLFWEWRRKD